MKAQRIVCVRTLADLPPENSGEIGELIGSVSSQIEEICREDRIKSGQIQLRTALHPSQITQEMSMNIASRLGLRNVQGDGNMNQVNGNIGIDESSSFQKSFPRNNLLRFVDEMLSGNNRMLIIIAGLDYLNSLRQVGLRFLELDRSSSQQEIDAAILPGYVYSFSRGGY